MVRVVIRRMLILGGGSEIAAAFVQRLVPEGLTDVVLAGRTGGSRDETATELDADLGDLSVTVADFDGAASSTHADVIAQIDQTHGPFDAVMVAFGQLGEPFTVDQDPTDAAELAAVNYAGVVSSCLASLNILRGEPNARLIVFSSIAAVRPRIGNVIYGSAKAGVDAFARELATPAKQVGVEVVVVRPGFVHSRMTQGLEAAPFATTPDVVANDLFEGLQKGRSIIHSPAILAPVGLVLKNLPAFVWQRISAR